MIQTQRQIDTSAGQPAPLGPTVVAGGVNFSLYSRDASGVELLFFDRVDDARPSRTIALDPGSNRTYHYWHVFVPGIQPGQFYGYRVHGPSILRMACASMSASSCSTRTAVASAVPKDYRRTAAQGHGDNAATAMKSVVVDTAAVRLGR